MINKIMQTKIKWAPSKTVRIGKRKKQFCSESINAEAECWVLNAEQQAAAPGSVAVTYAAACGATINTGDQDAIGAATPGAGASIQHGCRRRRSDLLLLLHHVLFPLI